MLAKITSSDLRQPNVNFSVTNINQKRFTTPEFKLNGSKLYLEEMQDSRLTTKR